jgi:hypothetical protein
VSTVLGVEPRDEGFVAQRREPIDVGSAPSADELGMERGLTVVCTPGSFGKTTLLNDWLNDWVRRSLRLAAWLWLDAGGQEYVGTLQSEIDSIDRAGEPAPTISFTAGELVAAG